MMTAGRFTIPAVAAPKTAFDDLVSPVALALDQEKRVTEQISQLALTAREEVDLVAEQFMHWFLQEQREEVSSMSDLLRVMERLADNVMLVEDYLARESGGDANPLESGAPPAAGGASADRPSEPRHPAGRGEAQRSTSQAAPATGCCGRTG
jgi:hypothetical protein